MIFQVQAISSIHIPCEEFWAELQTLGAELYFANNDPLAVFGIDEEMVQIRMTDANLLEYEDADFKGIEEKLGGAAQTFIAIEFGESISSFQRVVDVARALSKRWPIVLDDSHGTILAPSEFSQLLQ